MAAKKRQSAKMLRGLSKGSTYRLNPEVAFELELYGVIKKNGPKRQIIEEALAAWFRKNPIRPKVREAAMVILEEGAES